MTEITTLPAPQERAAVALKSVETEAKLVALANSTKSIGTVTNKDGRAEAHSAYMAAQQTRVAIEKIAKAAREDATVFSKAVIAEENRLISLIKPEEDRLKHLRDEWDAKEKAIKEAKEAAERERVAAIKARIKSFSDAIIEGATAATSGDVDALIAKVESTEIDDSFKEFFGDALEARGDALIKLKEICAAKKSAEALAQQIKAEREAQEKAAAEARAKLEAQREEERKANDEALRKIEAERLEIERQRKELEAQKAAADAEAKAKSEREAAAQPKPEAAPAPQPTNNVIPAEFSAKATPAEAVIEAEPRIAAFLNSREWAKGKAHEYRAVLVEYEKFLAKEAA